jgi:signal transduction histidine kinase
MTLEQDSRFKILGLGPTIVHLFFVFLVSLVPTAVAAEAPLTRIADALALSPERLSRKPPAHFRGVITCVDRAYDLRFLQDDSGGIYLYPFASQEELAPGDLVEATGTMMQGFFAPMLDSARVKIVGKAELPAALPVPLASVAAGAMLGLRIQTEGIVERTESLGDHLWIQIAQGESRVSLSVANADSALLNQLRDARVRVKGVAGAAFNKLHQLTGFQIFIGSLRDLEVIEPAPVDPMTIPIASLAHYTARQDNGHRVHLRGIVTLHWPGRETVIQDATGAVSIEKGVRPDVQPGDEIDVNGFLSGPAAAPRLRNVEVRATGKKSEVLPQLISLTNAWKSGQRLVRVLARVANWQPAVDGFISVLLEDDGEIVVAKLPAQGAPNIVKAYPSGATVHVVGVLKASSDVASPRFELWMRGPSDVSLIRGVPFSKREMLLRVGWVTGLIVIAAMSGLLWRQRHARSAAAAAQRAAEAQLEETQRQLRHARRDREHITQELHDNIIQSIFSVGISLDEARRKSDGLPEKLSERLSVAVEALNAVIRDVRAFITGGEPKSLDGPELKAALKSVLLASGIDEQRGFSLQIDTNAARELTSLQATEVFNIAREAMYNSIRHARADHTAVSLTSRGGIVALEVRDDGVGFARDNVGSTSMGLRNMESRANRIGAALEISSAPGSGTRVTVKVPTVVYDRH